MAERKIITYDGTGNTLKEEIRTVCDHCGRKPKAGLREVHGLLAEAQNDSASNIFDKKALLCGSCRDRVYRFMDRGFTAK